MPRPPAARALAAVLLALAVGCAGRAPGEGPPGVGSATVEWADFRIAWELQPAPDHRLRVLATVTNEGRRTLERELPRCLNGVRLYRGDALVWDRVGKGDCFGLDWLTLAPSESRSWRAGLTAAEVLGDSIPPGEFTVRVRIPGRTGPGLPRADIEVTLGQKTLRPE